MRSLVGDYIKLEPSNVIYTDSIGSVIEFNDILLICSYNPIDNNFYKYYNIELFNIETGNSIYFLTNESYSKLGNLNRIEKTNELENFDYRLVFDRAIVYKSSIDKNKEQVFYLPESIIPMPLDDPNQTGSFDVSVGNIVWSNEDGIWISSKNGDDPKCILQNSTLAVDYPDNDSENICYGNPRFIFGNSKIVVGIFRKDEQMYFSSLIYNLATATIESRLSVSLPDLIIYPVLDRYVSTKGARGSKVLDVVTGEYKEYFTEGNYPFYLSKDYKTVVVAKYNSMEFDGLKTFVTSIDNPKNESSPLIAVNDTATVYMRGISEHYVLFSSEKGDWAVISKYI